MIDTINVPVTRGRVDTISGVIYSNVFEGRHYRPLKMNLLLPSGKDKRPAVVYFPGGGFLSADNNSFLQMRMALTGAGNMAELVMVEGASHGDIYWFQKPVVDRVVDWFRKTLG